MRCATERTIQPRQSNAHPGSKFPTAVSNKNLWINALQPKTPLPQTARTKSRSRNSSPHSGWRSGSLFPSDRRNNRGQIRAKRTDSPRPQTQPQSQLAPRRRPLRDCPEACCTAALRIPPSQLGPSVHPCPLPPRRRAGPDVSPQRR